MSTNSADGQSTPFVHALQAGCIGASVSAVILQSSRPAMTVVPLGDMPASVS